MVRQPAPVQGWFYLAGLLLLAGLSYGVLRWVESSMQMDGLAAVLWQRGG